MNKFIGYAVGVALFAVGVVGVANSTPASAAAERCDASVSGPRGEAFKVNGTKASVKFKVSGVKGCKAEISAVSFYAPSMNGRPYDKQVRYDIVTKTFTPGEYTLTVNLPAKSTQAKGCYYQVDLTYGKRIHTPVIAYGHGKLDCSKPEKPVTPVTPETPVTPTPEEPGKGAPEVIAETGPAAVIGSIAGVGTLTASAGYWLQSRRNLKK
jgi:hypothetical protein